MARAVSGHNPLPRANAGEDFILASEYGQARPRLKSPDPEGVVARARDGASAIVCERYFPNTARVAFKDTGWLVSLQIPDPKPDLKSVIDITADGALAIVRQSHGVDPIRVAFQ
jgi:hypothetical protein